MINTFEGKTPEIGENSYVHSSADVLGNVKIGAGCWIGPGARIRGDYGRIVIGDLVSSVAKRTGCPVVGTDLVGVISAGPWRGRTYGGQSVVADAGGRILGVLRDRDVEVRVFDLPVGR